MATTEHDINKPGSACKRCGSTATPPQFATTAAVRA